RSGRAWSKREPAPSASGSPQPSPASETPAEPSPPFDKAAAIAAIEAGAAAAESCKGAEDPPGSVRLAVTFAPSGHVTSAVVTNPPFAATKTGSCIADAFRNVSVPSFDGESVRVFRTFELR